MNVASEENTKWEKRTRRLAIVHIFFGVLMAACGIIYFFFDDEFTSFALDHIFIDLPEVVELLTFILWILFALVNILIFLLAMVIMIAWEMVAPIIAIVSVPALAGGIGLLYKKKWALKTLLITSIFYTVLFFPLGLIIAILTFQAYRNNRNLSRNHSL